MLVSQELTPQILNGIPMLELSSEGENKNDDDG